MESARHFLIVLIALAALVSGGECLAQTKAKSYSGQTAELVGKIDGAVVEEFRKAWWVSQGGATEIEGVVLLYRKADGTITARSQGRTNQRRRFTLFWSPEVVAIVHTHPNSSTPKPESGDLEIADRLGIPVFTITSRGMYVYDPVTRRISKVKDGLEWLEAAKWDNGATVVISRQ